MNQRKSLLIDLGSGGGGTPGRWGNPVRWGNPPVHLISHFVRSRSFTGRVTRREGLPDLPDGVILSAGLTCGGVTSLAGVGLVLHQIRAIFEP